jgi:hypothetical protein
MIRKIYNSIKTSLQHLFKESTVENNQQPFVYTDDQLMARLKFFIGICLALTLTGIVFVVLFSLIFVTQPLNAISPIDQKFFELIIPIATFLTGTLSGIMLAGNDPESQRKAIDAASKGWDKPQTPIVVQNAPAPQYMPPPVQNSWGSAPLAAPAQFTPQVVTGYGGKPAPAQPDHPEL